MGHVSSHSTFSLIGMVAHLVRFYGKTGLVFELTLAQRSVYSRGFPRVLVPAVFGRVLQFMGYDN